MSYLLRVFTRRIPPTAPARPVAYLIWNGSPKMDPEMITCNEEVNPNLSKYPRFEYWEKKADQITNLKCTIDYESEWAPDIYPCDIFDELPEPEVEEWDSEKHEALYSVYF